MKIKFREKFEKDIESIINQDVLDDIVNAIENIEKAKKPQEIVNIKKLKGGIAIVIHSKYLNSSTSNR